MSRAGSKKVLKQDPFLSPLLDDVTINRTTAVRTDLGLPSPPSPLITSPFVGRRRYSTGSASKLRTIVFVACCIMFSEGFFGTHLFPYVSFMTEEMRNSKYLLGTYTGINYTAQSCGMLCSGYIWARVSNRFGRRICLLIGLSYVAVSTVVAAFCDNYWMMVFLRFFMGIMNNNLSIVRTSLREAFQLENEDDTSAFSMLSVAFGASSVAGPSCGGLLYGYMLPGTEGILHPWSTPLLLCSLMYTMTLVVTALCWPETAPLGPRNREEPGGLTRNGGGEGGPRSPLLQEGTFLLFLTTAGVHSYVFTGWELVYPLFARSAVDAGGEGWATSEIGVTFLVGSCGLIMYTLTLFNKIAMRVPRIRLYIWTWVPTLVMMPVFPRLIMSLRANGFPPHGPLFQVLNYSMQLLVSVLLGSQFITVQLLLNEYVSRDLEPSGRLALANGYLVSCQALVRAISPMTTGALFTLGGREFSVLGIPVISPALPFDHLALLGWIFGVAASAKFGRQLILDTS